ncbi:MAG TPA: MBL fold metallo-hydrolase [Clostridia bacterium]|nr:MBL fold metallo-hydrolase [Clostridia bacterium]
MKKKYFTDHVLLPNILHIEDPLGVFSTLIIGQDKALLFDTAFGIGNLKEHVSELTDLPLTVVNSHGHVDHLCGNYHFDQVFIHGKDIPVAESHTSAVMRRGTIAQAKSKGILPDGFDEEAYLATGPGNLALVDEGHIFDLGGITVEVIAVPGHTKGSIGLLLKEEKLILLGDAANPFLFLFLPESTDVAGYIETLNKINGIDFDRFIISHNKDILPKEKINVYIECATNIDIDKSKPFHFPPFKDVKALMYSHGDRRRDDPDFAAIIYTADRL